eukprot:PhF_6_TR410/c0_g1_i1/m.124/K13238/DCI; 3,2-trans-enoyl-CoA isomerase, mitochondrial
MFNSHEAFSSKPDGFTGSKYSEGVRLEDEDVFPYPHGDSRTPVLGLGGGPYKPNKHADPRIPFGREVTDPRLMRVIEGPKATPPPRRLIRPNEPKFLKCSVIETPSVANDPSSPPVRVGRIQLNDVYISLEMLEELKLWMSYFGNDDITQGVMVGSTTPDVFSLGLSDMEFSNPSEERFRQFWSLYQTVWMMFLTFPKVMVAEVEGSAHGAGLGLLITADWRVGVSSSSSSSSFRYDDCSRGLIVPQWIAAHGQSFFRSSRVLYDTPIPVSSIVDEFLPQGTHLGNGAHEIILSMMAAHTNNQGRAIAKDILRRDFVHVKGEIGTAKERDEEIATLTEVVRSEGFQQFHQQHLRK